MRRLRLPNELYALQCSCISGIILATLFSDGRTSRAPETNRSDERADLTQEQLLAATGPAVPPENPVGTSPLIEYC